MSQFEVTEFLNKNKYIKYTSNELCNKFEITRSSMGRLLKICFKNKFIDREIKTNKFPLEYSYFAKV